MSSTLRMYSSPSGQVIFISASIEKAYLVPLVHMVHISNLLLYLSRLRLTLQVLGETGSFLAEVGSFRYGDLAMPCNNGGTVRVLGFCTTGFWHMRLFEIDTSQRVNVPPVEAS